MNFISFFTILKISILCSYSSAYFTASDIFSIFSEKNMLKKKIFQKTGMRNISFPKNKFLKRSFFTEFRYMKNSCFG